MHRIIDIWTGQECYEMLNNRDHKIAHRSFCVVLENVENKTDLNSQVQDITTDALNYLDSRSDFWQQQKPLYCR